MTEKSHFERWRDVIEKLPGMKTAMPTEEAPKDGSTHRFRVILDMDAFWCDDLKRWVLVRPLHLEHVPTKAEHLPSFPNGEQR